MRYRVHRMKDAPQESFRWAAHTGGLAVVKVKDYEPGIEIEAPSSYAAWKILASKGEPLRPGDLLEALDATSGNTLEIAKYIGFEPAKWFIPEPKPDVSPVSEGDSANPPVMKKEAILGNPA